MASVMLSAIFFLSVFFTSGVFAENIQQEESTNQDQKVSTEIDADENERIEEKQVPKEDTTKDLPKEDRETAVSTDNVTARDVKASTIESRGVVETIADLENAVNNATGDVEVVLGDTIPTELVSTINFNINHNFNVVIKGNDAVTLKTLKAPNIENARHLKVNTTGSGTVTFKDLKLVGFNTVSGVDVTQGTTAGGIEINGSSTNPYNLFVDNCIIEGVTSSGAIGIGYNGNKVTITNSSFIGNVAVTSGAVINVDGPQINLEIEGCTFIGNKGTWPGYKGGAILLKGNDRDVNIKNSMFLYE